MYIARQMTDLSLIKIAESFNKDHSTVIHAIEKISALSEEDETIKDEVKSIIEKIEE